MNETVTTCVLGSGCSGKRDDSSMSVRMTQTNGVHKGFQSMTGSSRRRLLLLQAAKEKRNPEDLLTERKNRKKQWQIERKPLKSHRCPNCGHFGHNYHWCPFAHRIYLEQTIRFRGAGGTWKDTEPPLKLMQTEREMMSRHFAILSMRLGPT